MLSLKELAQIVKDEVENKIKKGELNNYLSIYYYILLDGKIYPGGNYDAEVKEGKRSANDIYAFVVVWPPSDFDNFLFYINYLEYPPAEDIAKAYLRKMGFTIEYYDVSYRDGTRHVSYSGELPPTPNLKYYISAKVLTPEYYLGINIYDIDALARTFYIPQIVEQELDNKPGKITKRITEDEFFDICEVVTKVRPLLAGYTYEKAWYILRDYFKFHVEKYKNEAFRIIFDYMNLFPTPYQVCYRWEDGKKWDDGKFVETNCPKTEPPLNFFMRFLFSYVDK